MRKIVLTTLALIFLFSSSFNDCKSQKKGTARIDLDFNEFFNEDGTAPRVFRGTIGTKVRIRITNIPSEIGLVRLDGARRRKVAADGSVKTRFRTEQLGGQRFLELRTFANKSTELAPRYMKLEVFSTGTCLDNSGAVCGELVFDNILTIDPVILQKSYSNFCELERDSASFVGLGECSGSPLGPTENSLVRLKGNQTFSVKELPSSDSETVIVIENRGRNPIVALCNNVQFVIDGNATFGLGAVPDSCGEDITFSLIRINNRRSLFSLTTTSFPN